MDAQRAFAEIVEEDLGYHGMRLDLFYPDFDFGDSREDSSEEGQGEA